MTNIKPVVLGLGNPLFQDEGLGVHIIHQLMKEEIALRAYLVDGGTDGLALLGVVEEAEILIIIDAIDGEAVPGTVQCLEGEDIPLFLGAKMSPHQIGFQEVLTLARLRGRLPARTILVGAQPLCLDWGTELTPLVAGAVQGIRDLIYAEIDGLDGPEP